MLAMASKGLWTGTAVVAQVQEITITITSTDEIEVTVDG